MAGVCQVHLSKQGAEPGFFTDMRPLLLTAATASLPPYGSDQSLVSCGAVRKVKAVRRTNFRPRTTSSFH